VVCALWIARPRDRSGEAASPESRAAAPESAGEVAGEVSGGAQRSSAAPATDDEAATRAEVAPGSPKSREAAARGLATATLRVHAVAQGGETPVADEFVLVQPPGTTWHADQTREGRTDANGDAVFTGLAVGHAWVRLLRGGEEGVLLTAGRTSDVRLAVFGGVKIVGSVVDAQGEPVPAAEIWLSERYRDNLGHIVAHCDAAGRFELERVGADQSVGARAAGYAPSISRQVRGAPGDTLTLSFVLDHPGVRVRGVVRDERGAAIADAQVMLGAEHPEYSQRSDDGAVSFTAPPLRTASDANGEFAFENAPLGLQPLQARARGFAPLLEDVATENTDRFPIEVRLVRHARVAGRALDDAQRPIASVWIHTGNPEHFAACSTYSGPDGKFELDDLAAGEVHLLAEHPSRGRAALDVTLGVGELREWTVVLPEQPRIFGRVIDEHGAPLEGWTVVAVPNGEESRRTRSQRVEASGGFAIVGLADEAHTLWVQRPGAWRDLPALTVDDVRPSTTALELRVPDEDRVNGRIVARVLAPSGQPAAGVTAQLWLVDRHMWREFAVDGASGNLAIEHVAPGTCQLQLVSTDFAKLNVGERSVRAGETLDLGVIRLAEGGHLIARLRGVGDELIAGLTAYIDDSEHSTSVRLTPEHAEMRSGPLATGQYRLSLRGDGVRSVQLPFGITAGTDTELEITLERCGTRLVVFDPPPNYARPSWLACVATGEQGANAWDGVVDISAPLEVRVSAPPGNYHFVVRHEQTVVAECSLSIPSVGGEAPPLHVALNP